ncbi:RTA1-domain-containing protein [Diplogelasinospora grovesii]|uniref:RTA1-domain-containing protein n=1 Tax=Diplogelasinospora grovesii TaxID=303347 RepID=A0AAN6RZY2_9PEZI|nr:RTA1-domain-containing protein [Diplogelasinospora grovesii]
MGVVCNPNWQTATWSEYRYVPSVGAAVFFCLLFLASTALHMFQMWKTKTWFLTPLVVGCLFEFIGFAARSSSASQEPGCWKLMPYIIQSMYILLAPALFAASIYMILGRIILLTDGESRSMIKQRWLTKTFVCGDILCFTMQGGGGGLVAAGRNNQSLGDIGNGVIIAGLVLQLLWFVFFAIVAAVFHRRMSLAPTASSGQPAIRWQSYLHTLYFVSGLIMVRSLFRVIEYVQGNTGYLLTTEAFLYVFDAVPMFIVVTWLHWKHPSEIGFLLRGLQPERNGFSLIKLSTVPSRFSKSSNFPRWPSSS